MIIPASAFLLSTYYFLTLVDDAAQFLALPMYLLRIYPSLSLLTTCNVFHAIHLYFYNGHSTTLFIHTPL